MYLSGTKMIPLKLQLSLLLIIFAFVQSGQSTENVNVTSFNNFLGLYFENFARVQLSNDNWKLLLHIDLQNAIEQFHRIDNLGLKIENMCKRFENVNGYNCNYMSEVQQTLSALEAQNLLISHILGVNSNLIGRTKRGLINAIGTIQKQLFGTLDDNDAKFFNEQINTLYQNQENFQKLLQDQITIKESVINHVNKTFEFIEDLDTKISKIIHKVSTFESQIDRDIQLNKVFTLFVSITERFALVQTHLIEILTYAVNGNIHPYVLGSTDLIQELVRIKMYIPDHLKLPISPSFDHLRIFFKIINVNVYYQDKRLHFLITVPLVTNLELNIYKITSVPRQIDSNLFL